VVGLAAPERQPDQQIAFDIADDIFRDRLGVGKVFGIQCKPRRNWDRQRPESDAAVGSYSVFAPEIRL
jgi:hypothetical protein